MSRCLPVPRQALSNTPEEVGDFLEENGVPRDASLAQKYIIATYFTCTVITTVGFGDISASNTAEQVRVRWREGAKAQQGKLGGDERLGVC